MIERWDSTDEVIARLRIALAERYEVQTAIGRGGMAIVFRAHDIRNDRPVAIKVLRPDLGERVGTGRFQREIRIAAQLQHPHILALYDSGVADGLLYYVMPYVAGESLAGRLRREGGIPVADAIELARQVAEALAHAHARGIVHRDVKPANILLSGGYALVADFGIAHLVAIAGSTGETMTHSGIVIGTPEYMSPEQASGDSHIDGRSDLYSLGCVLYEMLTGAPPFHGPTPHAVIAQQITEPPPPMRVARPEVGAAVESAVMTSLAKDPGDRFQDGRAFADALINGSHIARPKPWRHRMRAQRATLVLLAAVVVAAAVGAAVHARSGVATPRLRERDWLLMADLEGDHALAVSVRELLTAELNQSRAFTIMPRQQLNAVMRDAGIPETTTVNVDLARELAFRSAVRAIVSGRIAAVAPDQYAIVFHASDVADGSDLVSVASGTRAADVVRTTERLGRELREGLGEHGDAISADRPLLDIATPSFPAFRRYVDAIALSQKGDLQGSSRMAREAIDLDSGFASAWALLGTNYIDARDLDSARVALRQALRRPERLSDAARYRLLAEAAFAIDHDLAGAVRWYDLYLEQVPRSVGGNNNRALYLAYLGRYEDALAGFETAARINPFGPARAQMSLLNATTMLLALGRDDRARAVARELTGPFATYAQLQLAASGNRWEAVDSLAGIAIAAPAIPLWLRIEAVTAHAAAVASRGAVRAADSVLRDAAAAAHDQQRHWYQQVRLMLAIAAPGGAARPDALISTDSSAGGLLLGGMGAAVAGDTVAARVAQSRLQHLGARGITGLGHAPDVLEALVARSQNRWQDVVRVLGSDAVTGEHEAANLDHVASVMMRWLVADAYARLGRLDSASAFMELCLAPARTPPGHVSYRGVAYPYAHERLALWYAQRHDRDAALTHWRAARAALTNPDPSVQAALAATARGLKTNGIDVP